ncbi:hypothetical protein D3C87_1936060 [compost metagenome]
MLAYSVGRPVPAVWNRWFRPGSSRVVTSGLPAVAARIAARFSAAGACRSLAPPIARIGALTWPRAAAGWLDRK